MFLNYTYSLLGFLWDFYLTFYICFNVLNSFPVMQRPNLSSSRWWAVCDGTFLNNLSFPTDLNAVFILEFLDFYQKACWDFDCDSIESIVDQIGGNLHFNNNEPSDPWAWCIYLFIGFLNFFHQCFVVEIVDFCRLILSPRNL